MFIDKGDMVEIHIEEDRLLRSIALLQDMKEFAKEQTEEGVPETVDALTCAVETMMAFALEHFDFKEEENEPERT